MTALTLASGQHTWLRYNRGVALALPHPDEEWTIADVSFSQETIHTLLTNNLIRPVGKRSGRHERYVWKTKEATYEYVESNIEQNHLAPCGHSGVHCIKGGELYTCTNSECDETFDRETAEEIAR